MPLQQQQSIMLMCDLKFFSFFDVFFSLLFLFLFFLSFAVVFFLRFFSSVFFFFFVLFRFLFRSFASTVFFPLWLVSVLLVGRFIVGTFIVDSVCVCLLFYFSLQRYQRPSGRAQKQQRQRNKQNRNKSKKTKEGEKKIEKNLSRTVCSMLVFFHTFWLQLFLHCIYWPMEEEVSNRWWIIIE